MSKLKMNQCEPSKSADLLKKINLMETEVGSRLLFFTQEKLSWM